MAGIDPSKAIVIPVQMAPATCDERSVTHLYRASRIPKCLAQRDPRGESGMFRAFARYEVFVHSPRRQQTDHLSM